MRRAEVPATLSAQVDGLRRHGVRSLFLFGSVARDEAGPGSDVDLLVDFEAPPGFDRYMDLKFFLEDLLQTRVDLVMRGALRPRWRTRIEAEALRVA